MSFKSHIEKIIYYPFKLKYLNQKVFFSHIEKTWFFSWEHRVYILVCFKSHIWRKKKKPGLVRVRRVAWVPGQPTGSPGFGRAVTTAGLLLNPDRSSHQIDPPGRARFNNSAARNRKVQCLQLLLESIKLIYF